MIGGGCLCGGIRFEVERFVGPFELCHCNRCRKRSGTAFAAMIGVRADDFRWLQGRELIRSYDLEIVEMPPAYRSSFCQRCGSPVPDSEAPADWFEVPAGLLDEDPALCPDKHIFIELKAPWFEVQDTLPQLDKRALIRLRFRGAKPSRPGEAMLSRPREAKPPKPSEEA